MLKVLSEVFMLTLRKQGLLQRNKDLMWKVLSLNNLHPSGIMVPFLLIKSFNWTKEE